jgi:hypothetical protein
MKNAYRFQVERIAPLEAIVPWRTVRLRDETDARPQRT